MSIKLGYTDENDGMRGWYDYEMFITCYKVLFNINDALAVANADQPGDLIELDELWAWAETVMGVFNFLFFTVLVFGDKDGWKYFQNASMCVAQICAGPTCTDEEPVSKGLLAALIGVSNTGAGIGNLVRTADAAEENAIHVNN